VSRGEGPVDLVIEGAVPWRDGAWAAPSDIAVRGGRIDSILPAGAAGRAGANATLPASGCYALPGFVNTHTHLFQALLRGVADGLGLERWLLAVGEAYVAADPESSYVAAACAAAELLRSGATTLVEHGYPHPNREVHEAIIQALRDVGIRAVYCRGVADKADPTREWGFEPRLLEPFDHQLAHLEELLARHAGSRLTVGIAPPNPRALSPEAMREVRALSDRLGLCVSIHLGETGFDDRACLGHVGMRAVPYLDRHDFLWERLLAVHCVRVEATDRAVLARRSSGVSYNPVSNLRLGSGIAPIPEFLELGVAVGIGVDGAASNDTQDMFETIRFGSYVQRGRLRDASVLDAAAMIRMATDGANGALGLESRPRGLQPGAQADIVLLRYERELSGVPVTDPGVALLTHATSRSVEAVVVDGEVVVSDGRCRRVDEDDLIRRMGRLERSVPEPVLRAGARRSGERTGGGRGTSGGRWTS
jgi:cytosine/adenosine deaminase-related metal-dependent hydrolase